MRFVGGNLTVEVLQQILDAHLISGVTSVTGYNSASKVLTIVCDGVSREIPCETDAAGTLFLDESVLEPGFVLTQREYLDSNTYKADHGYLYRIVDEVPNFVAGKENEVCLAFYKTYFQNTRQLAPLVSIVNENVNCVFPFRLGDVTVLGILRTPKLSFFQAFLDYTGTTKDRFCKYVGNCELVEIWSATGFKYVCLKSVVPHSSYNPCCKRTYSVLDTVWCTSMVGSTLATLLETYSLPPWPRICRQGVDDDAESNDQPSPAIQMVEFATIPNSLVFDECTTRFLYREKVINPFNVRDVNYSFVLGEEKFDALTSSVGLVSKYLRTHDYTQYVLNNENDVMAAHTSRTLEGFLRKHFCDKSGRVVRTFVPFNCVAAYNLCRTMEVSFASAYLFVCLTSDNFNIDVCPVGDSVSSFEHLKSNYLAVIDTFGPKNSVKLSRENGVLYNLRSFVDEYTFCNHSMYSTHIRDKFLAHDKVRHGLKKFDGAAIVEEVASLVEIYEKFLKMEPETTEWLESLTIKEQSYDQMTNFKAVYDLVQSPPPLIMDLTFRYVRDFVYILNIGDEVCGLQILAATGFPVCTIQVPTFHFWYQLTQASIGFLGPQESKISNPKIEYNVVSLFSNSRTTYATTLHQSVKAFKAASLSVRALNDLSPTVEPAKYYEILYTTKVGAARRTQGYVDSWLNPLPQLDLTPLLSNDNGVSSSSGIGYEAEFQSNPQPVYKQERVSTRSSLESVLSFFSFVLWLLSFPFAVIRFPFVKIGRAFVWVWSSFQKYAAVRWINNWYKEILTGFFTIILVVIFYQKWIKRGSNASVRRQGIIESTIDFEELHSNLRKYKHLDTGAIPLTAAVRPPQAKYSMGFIAHSNNTYFMLSNGSQIKLYEVYTDFYNLFIEVVTDYKLSDIIVIGSKEYSHLGQLMSDIRCPVLTVNSSNLSDEGSTRFLNSLANLGRSLGSISRFLDYTGASSFLSAFAAGLGLVSFTVDLKKKITVDASLFDDKLEVGTEVNLFESDNFDKFRKQLRQSDLMGKMTMALDVFTRSVSKCKWELGVASVVTMTLIAYVVYRMTFTRRANIRIYSKKYAKSSVSTEGKNRNYIQSGGDDNWDPSYSKRQRVRENADSIFESDRVDFDPAEKDNSEYVPRFTNASTGKRVSAADLRGKPWADYSFDGKQLRNAGKSVKISEPVADKKEQTSAQVPKSKRIPKAQLSQNNPFYPQKVEAPPLPSPAPAKVDDKKTVPVVVAGSPVSKLTSKITGVLATLDKKDAKITEKLSPTFKSPEGVVDDKNVTLNTKVSNSVWAVHYKNTLLGQCMDLNLTGRKFTALDMKNPDMIKTNVICDPKKRYLVTTTHFLSKYMDEIVADPTVLNIRNGSSSNIQLLKSSNIYMFEDTDITVFEVPASMMSNQLSIRICQTAKNVNNVMICSWLNLSGNKSDTPVLGVGQMLPSGSDGLVHHTANTVHGWSGTPILISDEAYAIHQGCIQSRGVNIGTQLAFWFLRAPKGV